MHSTNLILVGEFIINGYDVRKIWRNVETGVYVITDKSGIAPTEIKDLTFCSLDDITMYYKSQFYDITITSTNNQLRVPLLHAGIE